MSDPNPAQGRLDGLLGNPAWVGRLMQGDAAAKAEFNGLGAYLAGVAPEPPPAETAAAALTEPSNRAAFDPLAANARATLPATDSVAPGELSSRELLEFVEVRRARGANDVLIREALDETRAYSPELVAEAQEYWTSLSSDPKFR
jgi:hypothetical protein